MRKCLLSLFLIINFLFLSACQKSLPSPEIESGMRGELGIDANINEATIDDYLNRDDTVYYDMRMLIDEANYEEIGGDSYLSGFIEGFEVIPYPYLCEVTGLPEAVGEGYSGETLFSLDEDGNYVANYEESYEIIESLFPHDKYIFLMCGGGGYANMTKKLLVGLGYDENKIYNIGGYWYYQGNNKVEVKYYKDDKAYYNFALVNYHSIDFDSLTCLNCELQEQKDVETKVSESDFIKLESLDDLSELENEHKSFLLFIYLSGCPTCANFLPLIKQFSDEYAIQIYSLDLHKVFDSRNSITSRIQYAPSLFIYKDGEVIAYLNPQTDEDKKYYQEYVELVNWISSNININELECKTCKIN